MSILETLNSIKSTIPHYWPIGTFIHHNPLKGFENLHFKEGLKQAQSIYGGKVYMPSGYYVDLFHQDKIDESVLDKNLSKLLQDKKLESYQNEAKTFLLEISPKWESLRDYETLKTETIDQELHTYIKEHSLYTNKEEWIASLSKRMTLYEMHDALFGTSDTELIEKDIIEFIARFLDDNQTTLSMEDRDLGMFSTFKLYEEIEFNGNSEQYVQEILSHLQIKDTKNYLLTHLLKLHGWAGLIKYRSEDPEYYSQQMHPSTLMDYMAIRLHFEKKYLSKEHINNFTIMQAYIESNPSYTILKLLQSKGKLTGKFVDALEQKNDYSTILDAFIENEINLDTLQIQQVKQMLPDIDMNLIDCYNFCTFLKDEEGYLWLKAHEDTYIKEFVDSYFKNDNKEERTSEATAIFCLDVRSEVIRRKIEEVGNYNTFGAGGFLGIPISFIEFDKAHKLQLAPAIVKPQNIVLEIPVEEHEEYNKANMVNKTTKKVLNDLKNNPYTPYILVEAIGWIFGIKLFGKTFFPHKVQKLFYKLKPKKPKTTLTLDKLNDEEIERYAKQLHLNIIQEVLTTQTNVHLDDIKIELLWKHLVFDEVLPFKIDNDLIEKLKHAYKVTNEDYETQKNNLQHVGFSHDEQVHYVQNILKMIGLTKNFSKYIIVAGHGSCSDNNPFESALDCGACGGSISLPNSRTIAYLANKPEVRKALEEKGIYIPKESTFIPALHNTTTDEIEYYDTDILSEEDFKEFVKIKDDFSKASLQSREERVQVLPNAHKESDLFLKTMDWSEPRPEWGLAKNMGAFAGPRKSIKHMPFQNRLFMHSYDANIDNENADILTKIFDGPLVVGEWINLEHYFSTVDNKIYGAGSKVYHNVVSKVGVYNGNYSDLKIGLPTQSVFIEGKAYHEPVRLLTFMEAPLEKVGKAVENSVAQPFILNEWIRPIIIDKEAKKVYSYEYGEFIVIKELD